MPEGGDGVGGEAVAVQATPVGSGTVARTARLDLEDKAELARRVQAQPANRIEAKASPTPVQVDHTDRTATFLWETPETTVKAHPELAGTVAASIAIDRQVKDSELTAAQQSIVATRVRQNIVNSIERGDTPSLKISVPVEPARTTKPEREYVR